MPDFLIENNFLIMTPTPDQPTVSNPVYEPRAIFSINASNQLQATIWIVKDGTQMITNIGTASYVIHDKDGNAVPGLAESGIVADGNAYFIIAPVNAASILDLTHYTARISVAADNLVRTGVVGITLGE